MNSSNILWTIGHGRRSIDEFVKLLVSCEITALVDVRTVPASRWAPDFNRNRLLQTLQSAGIAYVFLGEELGGRPNGSEYYFDSGHVKYRKVANSEIFRAGIQRLMDGIKDHNIVLMCSESDHHDCHRNLLIGRVLDGKGVEVRHITKMDGIAFQEVKVEAADQFVFDDELVDEWKSAVQVRQPHDAQIA